MDWSWVCKVDTNAFADMRMSSQLVESSKQPSERVALITSVTVLSVMAGLCLIASLFGVFCCVVRKKQKRFRELLDDLDNVRQQLLAINE